jgi:hypothetical protein
MDFSFNWFRKNKQKETKVAEVVEMTKEDVVVVPKPYMSVKMVGKVLTVVLNDGSILTKEDADIHDFNNVRMSMYEKDVINVLINVVERINATKELIEEQEVEKVIEGVSILKKCDDFIVEGNSVKMKLTNRTLPQILVEKFAVIMSNNPNYKEDEEYIALKRFFMWCCLNPRAEVADKLYDFLQKNGMRITKQGFFVALRNVVRVPGIDTEFTEFVCNAYNKVKAVWKKHPRIYTVYQNDEGEYGLTTNVCTYQFQSKNNVVKGNLLHLYNTLPENEENRYTDDYSRTFDIRIGKVVSMAPEDCSWSTKDCATAGLHFAGHTAPYVLCGDTTVFTLHNPMKVVGIGTEKGRCYEYLPFMTTTVDEADEIMKSREFDFLQLDEQYAIDELANLEENVKKGFAAEATKHEFNIPTLSSIEMRNIISSLEDIQKEVEKRVVTL